jgi:hypothetical protein
MKIKASHAVSSLSLNCSVKIRGAAFFVFETQQEIERRLATKNKQKRKPVEPNSGLWYKKYFVLVLERFRLFLLVCPR